MLLSPQVEKAFLMEYEHLGLLHEIFRRQAKMTPDNIAVVSADGRQMTFKELDNVTDMVALNLRRRGVVPDSIVGIYMERCLEYAVAYISILKAGGAYMPIDPSYPIPLLEDILSDALPVAVFVDPDMVQYIPTNSQVTVSGNVIICNEGWMDKLEEENKRHKEDLEEVAMTLDSLAYTVYSSGTTGKPKGIQCPHRGAVFSYHWRHVNYPYQDGDREACNVFFVWEMFRPLLKGIPLYIIPDSVIYDPRLLCKFLKENKITRILFTPSLLEAVMDADDVDVSGNLQSMRTILFCGEVVTTALLDRCLKALPHVQFVNLYSISESHDIACGELTEWSRADPDNLKKQKFCPVGRLLPGVSVVIVDQDMQPQPVGVPGEIYVGGPTLARGYLNRPDMNKKRFVPRPDSVPAKVGDRLYKTGDWGYMLSNGSFEICGRCDSMVKVRGYSIETQAVEAALLELPLVNACVVVVMGEEGEDKYLVAYLVPEGKATKKEIRAALKRQLPFYMIPSYFVFLTNIPILASAGKLDKKALPPIDQGENEVDPESAPSTETEKKLAPLWMDVLQLKGVDIQESFFDLGGHSLLATKLLGKVKEAFGIELSVKDLFIYSTVFAMAKLLDARLNKAGSGDAPSLLPKLDLLKEVERHDQSILSMDIQLRAFWRSMQYGDRWDKSRVLLTGATGFLGSFILRDLLLHTKAHIFCLIRELPEQKGLDRIRASLSQYGVVAMRGRRSTEEQHIIEEKLESRVTVIKGDVGLKNMGTSEEDYTYLCTEVDAIIHAAAYVNLIYPYQALHGPNVLGTQNVVLFACTSKIKPLHYISTDAVFPHGINDCPEDADMYQYADQLTDGYSQSKWVAEQLVRCAMERGLPACIYRPGNLSGDSTHAYWNPQDFTLLMLQGCLYTGYAPDISWDVEMTPVDFISKLVVTLFQRMALGLGKVFNVANPNTIKSRWLFEWLGAHGYPLKTVSYKNWVKQVETTSQRMSGNGLLQRLLDSMAEDESFFSKLSTYRQDNVQKVLNILKMDYPEINHQLLRKYFSQLAKRRIIPNVRRNTTLDKPLDGQVAIVTGASSGIGAAISTHLARAGALVAMAARREDRLLDVKSSIERDGGIAIAVKCDVTDRQNVAEMVKHTECTLGSVDILVNNAGIMMYTMMKNLKEEEWHKQLDLNCKGMLNCIGSVLDGMLKRKRGHIINMSSNAGRRGFAGLAVYSGTKFFVEGLSQGMRQELAKTGIKVTCIQPGDVKTELLNHTTDMEARDEFDGSDKNEILESDDIGRAVVYAATQPSYAAVNEILIEPREAPI